MKVEPEQRAALLGEYIAKNSATVRATARAFGCSKSTVHKDVSSRLRRVDPDLFQRVQAVLARNKAERHLRGGAATRRKYGKKKSGGASLYIGYIRVRRFCCYLLRNCSSAAFSSRLTCAWLMPISRATSICVSPLR